MLSATRTPHPNLHPSLSLGHFSLRPGASNRLPRISIGWQLSAQAPNSSCSEALDGGLSNKFAASWCGRACAGACDLCCRIRACLTEETTLDVEKSLDALLQVLLSWVLLEIVAGACATLLRQVEMTRKKVAATTQQPPHFHPCILQPCTIWHGRPPVVYDVARPSTSHIRVQPLSGCPF